jgi:hypothetical protein
MLELGSSGSVRGVSSNGHPYRDPLYGPTSQGLLWRPLCARQRAHDRGNDQLACRSAPIPDLKVEATPERIARDKTLIDGFCSARHSKTGRLSSPVASNLTPGRAIEALVRR